MLNHWIARCVGLVALALVACAGAASASTAPQTPEALAAFVERRAGQTDFARLEDFGREALKRNDREGLNRLYHVTWILLNQGDFEKATAWNARLAQRAAALNDDRYRKIAHLNDLTVRYDTGDTNAAEEMQRIAKTDPDWFVGAHAVRLTALALMDVDEIGQGLRLLTGFEARIPPKDPYGDTARAGLWEVAGIGLMKLNDLGGATRAFQRFEVDFSSPDYPRPDFDSLYNLTRIALQLGENGQAATLYAAHQRLARRAGMESLSAYDANLCVMVARGRQDWPGVLSCIAPYGANLGAAEFLGSQLLPARAIALARTGRIDAAQQDLAEIRRRIASGDFNEEGPSQLNLVEAEILFATGRPAEGYRKLDQFRRAEDVYSARRFSAGIGQVTGDLQEQLDERRLQLSTAHSNTELQKVVIDSQRWLVGVIAVSLLSALGLVIWLVRQAMRLREARSRAEAASRAKSEFLANMSHEIRTPLNGVVAMADALSREPMSPHQRDMIDIVRTSGATLERLLSDILDSAKIEAGQLSLETAPFALHQTVRDLAALWRAKAEDKNLLLEVEIDPALPHHVLGDVVRIRQVLGNLVSNAIKFTGDGHVRVTVQVDGEDGVLFAVTDTGVGFDDEQMGRIFTRFQQADGSITRRYGGTGLGLAISRDLVARMGGEMNCASAAGQGARFWFRVPLPATAAPVPVATAGDVAAPRANQGPLRILLADDHPANRKVVEVLLGAADVEILAVENGRQAVEAFEASQFDLVLMDMQMPVMDGLSATRRIRKFEHIGGLNRTPLLMLTANAMAEHVEAGVLAGADGHLTKPITSDRLFAAIEAALSIAGDDQAEAGRATDAA